VDFGDNQPTAETRLYPRLCTANQTRNLTFRLNLLDLRLSETNQWAWVLNPSFQVNFNRQHNSAFANMIKWQEMVTTLERLTVVLSFDQVQFNCIDFHKQFDKLRETLNLRHFANRAKRVKVVVEGIRCCQYSYKRVDEQGDACIKLFTKVAHPDCDSDVASKIVKLSYRCMRVRKLFKDKRKPR
jgi:hypothetical protein